MKSIYTHPVLADLCTMYRTYTKFNIFCCQLLLKPPVKIAIFVAYYCQS